MATDGHLIKATGGNRWTMFIWGGAALLLSLPFFAMGFTSEVNWTASDFVVMGIMLGVVCGAIELAVRFSGNWAYRGSSASLSGKRFAQRLPSARRRCRKIASYRPSPSMARMPAKDFLSSLRMQS